MKNRENSVTQYISKWVLLLLSLVALTLAGCGESDKFYGDTTTETELSDSVATYISVTASPNLVGTNEVAATDITATVYDQYGKGVADVPMTFATNANSGGSFPVPVALTGSGGEATISYNSGATGGVVDTITVSGGGLTGTVDVGVQTVIPPISEVTLTVNPALPEFTAGYTNTNTVNIEVGVRDTSNQGVSGQTVLLTLVGDGSFSATSSSAINVTTDSLGSATAALTIPDRISTGGATITAQVVSSSGTVTDTLSLTYRNDAVSDIKLSASPTTIGLTDTSTIQAVVRDQYGNAVPNEELIFTLDATNRVSTTATFTDVGGFSSAEGTAKTDSNGVATIDYNAGAAAAGTDQIVVTALNGASNTINLTIQTTSTSIADVTISANSAEITADGTSATAITATVTDNTGAVVEGETVSFTTTAGTFTGGVTTLSEVTNAAGDAIVTLNSVTNLATATVTATVGGYSATTTVDFVAGPIANGVVSAIPATLPADGTSTSEITIALTDANNLPVTDGTTVQLLQELSGVTDAKITSSNPTTTTSGRATFTVQAATSAGTDTFYLFQDNTISYLMTYGAGTSAGDPASIQISSDRSQISVAGVGKEETATVTIQVSDGTGAPIDDETYNNIRVSLVTRPNAGEYVSGTSNPTAPTPVNSIATGEILIYTTAGQTTFGVQSGTLPGVVEILVEVIDDLGATVISAVVPQMVIASGPAHTIVLTAPNTGAVENLGAGVYRRIGTAVVTDRYGNEVPDGTVVNLGVLDSIIAYDDDGATTAGTSTATDAGTGTGGVASLHTDTIYRNDVDRPIQPNDRILFKNAEAEDKTRFISSVDGFNQLSVQKNYQNTASDLDYVIGASTLGAQILGVDHAGTGNEVVGYGTTVDGQVTFYVKYPANEQTIHVGCVAYGMACTDATYQTEAGCTGAGEQWVAYHDERYSPNDSAEVYVVASVSEATTESAVTVDKGQFCFASLLDWELGAVPEKLSGDGEVTLSLTDNSSQGGKIALPFISLDASVVIDSRAEGVCTDGSSSTQATCLADNETWTAGSCSDGVSTDQATCTGGGGIWTSGECTDGVSTTENDCLANNETWTPDTFNIGTTDLSCITDNPGEFVANVSAVSGTCTATVDVTGSGHVSGDKATITWYAGGGASASVTVEIP